jgi:hypothetical protein
LSGLQVLEDCVLRGLSIPCRTAPLVLDLDNGPPLIEASVFAILGNEISVKIPGIQVLSPILSARTSFEPKVRSLLPPNDFLDCIPAPFVVHLSVAVHASATSNDLPIFSGIPSKLVSVPDQIGQLLVKLCAVPFGGGPGCHVIVHWLR